MFEFEEGYDRYSKMEKGLRSKIWRQGVEEAKELADINAGRVPVTHHFSDAPPDAAPSNDGPTKPRPRSSSVEAITKRVSSSQLPSSHGTISAPGEDPAAKPSSKKPPGTADAPSKQIPLKKKQLAVEDATFLPPKKKISKPRPATAPSSLAAGSGEGKASKPHKPIKPPKPRPASALLPSLPGQPKKIKPIGRSKLSAASLPSQPPLASLGPEGLAGTNPPPPPPEKKEPWTSYLVPTSDGPLLPPLPPIVVADKPLRLSLHPRHGELKPYHSRLGLKRSRLVMTRAMEEYCEVSHAWFLSLPPASSPYADWAGYLRACGIISEAPPPPPPPPSSLPTADLALPTASEAVDLEAVANLAPSESEAPPSLPEPAAPIPEPEPVSVKDEPLHPPPPPPPPPPALILKPCSASEALSWLKALALGDKSSLDLEEGQVEAAKRKALLTDKRIRSKYFQDLADAAPPPAVATGAGNMDLSVKRTLMHVARVALPSSVGAAIVSSLSPPLGDTSAQPLPASVGGDGVGGGGGGAGSHLGSYPVHVVLRINGDILPFVSPATLHPPPAPSALPLLGGGGGGGGGGSTRGGGQYQVQGLQGALACFNPCTKFIEGWQLLALPGLLLLSLEVPDMSKATVPKPPTLPPRPTPGSHLHLPGQAVNPIIQKHKRQALGLGEDSGADSDSSRGNSRSLNRVLKKARQVVNARPSPMKPTYKPYDPSKPFEFHHHPYVIQPPRKSLALASPLAGAGLKKGRSILAVDSWEEVCDLRGDGDLTEEDADMDIEGMSDDEMDVKGSRRRGGRSRRSALMGLDGSSIGGGSDVDFDDEEDDDMDLDDDNTEGGRGRYGRKGSFTLGLGLHPRCKASLASPNPFSSVTSLPSFSRPSVIKPTDLPEVFVYKGSLPSSLVDVASARIAIGPPFPSSRKTSLFPAEVEPPAVRQALQVFPLLPLMALTPLTLQTPQVPPPPLKVTLEVKVSDSDDEAYEVVLNNTWGAFYSTSGPPELIHAKSHAGGKQVEAMSQTLAWAGAWNRHLAMRKGVEAAEGLGGGKLAQPQPSPMNVNSPPLTSTDAPEQSLPNDII